MLLGQSYQGWGVTLYAIQGVGGLHTSLSVDLLGFPTTDLGPLQAVGVGEDLLLSRVDCPIRRLRWMHGRGLRCLVLVLKQRAFILVRVDS